jgi:hypothetical protein
MVSRSVLRKPTIAQTWRRALRDQETGIPGRGMRLTTEPTREELETWAIQIGFDPRHYLTAWVCLRAEAQSKSRL